MGGDRILLAVAALALLGAALPTPTGAAPAEVCDTVGVDATCEEALSTAEARDLAAGWWHNCALLVTGNVECWGHDAHGQAPSYDGGDAIDVDAGGNQTCAVLVDGDLRCWGDGWSGSVVLTGVAEVAVGGFHVCVLTDEADAPTALRDLAGGEPGDVVCMGDDGYGQAADRRTGDNVEVAAGGYHTCARLEGGSIDCWGYDQDDRTAPTGAGQAVEAGVSTTCVLRETGDVDCFGRNDKGQASDYEGDDAVEVAPGGTHVCVRVTNGTVDCQGDDRHGQAADHDLGDAQAVEAGFAHTCVLRLDGSVDCWGDDRHGQAAGARPGPILPSG